MPLPDAAHPRPRSPVTEVFLIFLKLGLTSFGGPLAHLGFFRAELVERRRWLTDEDFSDLVALCQCLPGPTSSQVGIGLGLGRAGWPGALAAWLGFTLPSALLLTLVALGAQQWQSPALDGGLHGLKVLAVAIVAQAVWGMARSLCPDGPRAVLAVAAGGLALALPGAAGQLGAIALGALTGWAVLHGVTDTGAATWRAPVSRRAGTALLLTFASLLIALPVVAHLSGNLLWQAVSVCYRASAMVFGGGHVVLPLLQSGVVDAGWMSTEQFLAGYGAAQAVPGPLFTFAAYLGASLPLPGGASPWLGALALVVAIFLPAFLAVLGALPFWHAWRQQVGVRRVLPGVNAAVVGVLGAALISPIGTSALQGPVDIAMAAVALALLMRWRWPAVWLVVLSAAAGALFMPMWQG